MVHQALHDFPWRELDFLFIENVGNLVCPAIYDLGQAVNVVALSVTEGEDKPLKYPVMFRKADLVLLTKIDLLPHLPDVTPRRAIEDALARVMPRPGADSGLGRTRRGLAAWTALARVAADRRRAASADAVPGRPRELGAVRRARPGRRHGREPPHARAGSLGAVRGAGARARLVGGPDARASRSPAASATSRCRRCSVWPGSSSARMIERFGRRMEAVAGVLLVGFGVAYAIWGLRRAAGRKLHGHAHVHYDHVHDPGRMTAWTLFLLFSADPCVAVIPLLFAAAPLGAAPAAGIVLVYEVATLATMVALVLPARAGAARLRAPVARPLRRRASPAA